MRPEEYASLRYPPASLSRSPLPCADILTLTCALLSAVLVSNAAAEPVKFVRHPHASNGKLVFSYHGDIWIANENGSNPMRLTAHVARDTFPAAVT
jgi:hypothetical protein